MKNFFDKLNNLVLSIWKTKESHLAKPNLKKKSEEEGFALLHIKIFYIMMVNENNMVLM